MKWFAVWALVLFTWFATFITFRGFLLSSVPDPNLSADSVTLFMANNTDVIAGLMGVLFAAVVYYPVKLFVGSFGVTK